MSVFYGGGKQKSIYYGSKKIDKIYKENTLVYQSTQKVPLIGEWYGFESDNSFEIYNDSTLKETYHTISGGMGRVFATFGSEYFIYHDGVSEIKWWNQQDNHGVLLTLYGDSSSLVCYDNNFVVLTRNGNIVTAKAYTITGTNSEPVATPVTEINISIPSDGTEMIYDLCAARINETDAYVMEYRQGASTPYTFQRLKLTNNATYKPSLSYSWESGRLWEAPVPMAGAWVTTQNTRAFWSPRMKYYVTRTNNTSQRLKTFAVYRVSDNQKMFEHTYTNVGSFSPLAVRFFLDQDTGNGYVTTITRNTSSIISTLYRLNNWQQEQITQKVGGLTLSGYNTSDDGIFPLCDNKIPSILLRYNIGKLYFKVSFTTDSITTGAPTLTTDETFGSWVRWA